MQSNILCVSVACGDFRDKEVWQSQITNLSRIRKAQDKLAYETRYKLFLNTAPVSVFLILLLELLESSKCNSIIDIKADAAKDPFVIIYVGCTE